MVGGGAEGAAARLRRAIDRTIRRGCSRVLWRIYAWFFVPEKLSALTLI